MSTDTAAAQQSSNHLSKEDTPIQPTMETRGVIKTKGIDVVAAHLQDKQRTFHVMKEGNCIRATASGDNGTFPSFYTVDEEGKVLKLLMFYCNKVSEAKRPQVMEFLSRANYGLIVGNFEMDHRDGEIRYRGSIQYEPTELYATMVENLFQICGSTINRYYPGLMKVIYADASPADAIAEIETGVRPSQTVVAQLVEPLGGDTEEASETSPENDNLPVASVSSADE